MNHLDAEVEFPCTPGGAVAVGIRRMRLLLSTLALLMIGGAVAAWLGGRFIPGVIAIAVAGVIGMACRLILDPGRMRIETQAQTISITIEKAQIRRLNEEEIVHLESLASAGGFVAGSGGFDSRQLGEFDLYASNLANALLIHAPEGRYVVTPDRPVDFLPLFHQMAASPLLQS